MHDICYVRFAAPHSGEPLSWPRVKGQKCMEFGEPRHIPSREEPGVTMSNHLKCKARVGRGGGKFSVRCRGFSAASRCFSPEALLASPAVLELIWVCTASIPNPKVASCLVSNEILSLPLPLHVPLPLPALPPPPPLSFPLSLLPPPSLVITPSLIPSPSLPPSLPLPSSHPPSSCMEFLLVVL